MKSAIDDNTDFDTDKEIMNLFSSTARTFIQLSSAALALTIIFSEDVLGVQAPIKATDCLIATWILFLLAIFFGALYQYFAIKFLEVKHASGYLLLKLYPKFLYKYPGIMFGCMMVSFIAGGILLIITSYRGLH